MNARQEELAKRLREQAEREQAAARPEPTPEPTPEPVTPQRANGRRKATDDTGGWTGAQPRQMIKRRPLNVGMPEELEIHRRLGMLAADTGISAQDAVAEAIDAWLTEHGYPRTAGKRR